MGAQSDDCRKPLPMFDGGVAKMIRFRRALNLAWLGGRHSMANPTKSSGGWGSSQSIPSSAIPSPRWTLSRNGAFGLVPRTSNPLPNVVPPVRPVASIGRARHGVGWPLSPFEGQCEGLRRSVVAGGLLGRVGPGERKVSRFVTHDRTQLVLSGPVREDPDDVGAIGRVGAFEAVAQSALRRRDDRVDER